MGNKKFTKKLKGLSLFANVGMAETYLPELGVEIVTANELLQERADFYKHLHPSTNMICGDITDDEVFENVMADAQSKNVEFVIATPPCQGMSCAGKKDPLDPRNYLIYYAIKAIKRIKPRFVIIENVPMQAHTTINLDGKKMFIPDYVERELGQDYSFNHTRIVNAKDYGVPQSRQRYIYLLSLKSEGIKWEFPVPNGEVTTIRDAIGHLPSLDPLLRETEERWGVQNIVQDFKILNIFTDPSIDLIISEKDEETKKNYYFIRRSILEKYQKEINAIEAVYQPMQMLVASSSTPRAINKWLMGGILGRVSNNKFIFQVDWTNPEMRDHFVYKGLRSSVLGSALITA